MADRVRTSTGKAVADAGLTHVSIDSDRLDAFAERFRDRTFRLPDWRVPVMIDRSEYSTETVFDFFLVGNTLNFVFDDIDTGETFTTTYDGEQWRGAYAMWASLKRALEDGLDVTDGAVLRGLTVEETAELFRGDPPIPLVDQRHEMLTHVGERLCAVADGNFHTVWPPDADVRMYDDGDGLVEWLTREFPEAYADARQYRGETVYFDKQAKLSVGMIEGRFRDRPAYTVADFGEMTIFADYLIPALFRAEGVFDYSESLTEAVDTGTHLPEGSVEEVEIRIATIRAGDQLLEAINADRAEPITGFHLDQALWQMGRDRDLVHHLTETTTY